MAVSALYWEAKDIPPAPHPLAGEYTIGGELHADTSANPEPVTQYTYFNRADNPDEPLKEMDHCIGYINVGDDKLIMWTPILTQDVGRLLRHTDCEIIRRVTP